MTLWSYESETSIYFLFSHDLILFTCKVNLVVPKGRLTRVTKQPPAPQNLTCIPHTPRFAFRFQVLTRRIQLAKVSIVRLCHKYRRRTGKALELLDGQTGQRSVLEEGGTLVTGNIRHNPPTQISTAAGMTLRLPYLQGNPLEVDMGMAENNF